MTTEFYEEIKNAFSDIMFDPLGSIRAEITLKTAKRELKKEKESEDNRLLIYCIDTMFDILNERNAEKIHDFAHTVCNISKIPMGLRDFYSFVPEIDAFREKYGVRYFEDFMKVRPRYSKYAPKNAWVYFLPNSDDDFKSQHPVAYGWLRTLGVIVLLLPMIVHLLFGLLNPYVFNSGFVMLGYAGSIMIGIGLFNIMAAFVHQYMGHKMTIICLGGGGFLILLTYCIFRFML